MGMDRLQDVLKAVKVYSDLTNEHLAISSGELSLFLKLASSVSSLLTQNEEYIEKISILTGRKEFYNDPSEELAELSLAFERNVKSIQKLLSQLSDYESRTVELRGQTRQHYHLIIEQLTGRQSRLLQNFKTRLKQHAENIRQRQARLSRYGDSPSMSLSSMPLQDAQQYAMFAGRPAVAPSAAPSITPLPSSLVPSVNPHGSSSLRRRPPLSSAVAPLRTAATQQLPLVDSQAQTQQQVHRLRSVHQEESRRAALQVEASLNQVGELFAQMHHLILSQADRVSRIEDDMESGLVDTTEAHRSMESVYDLTKGNRGVIVKVLLLLVVFILLLLVFF